MTAGRNISNNNKDWCTPKKYIDSVKVVLGEIWLDPCSNHFSIIGAKEEYLLPERDGLKENWDFPTIYVNPPYGFDKGRNTRIKDWFRKVYEAYKLYNSQVILLVPVATNTSHWKEYVWNHATAICFLYDTRLKFMIGGSEDNKGAPMACAMIYYGNVFELFKEEFIKHGAVIKL